MLIKLQREHLHVENLIGGSAQYPNLSSFIKDFHQETRGDSISFTQSVENLSVAIKMKVAKLKDDTEKAMAAQDAKMAQTANDFSIDKLVALTSEKVAKLMQ